MSPFRTWGYVRSFAVINNASNTLTPIVTHMSMSANIKSISREWSGKNRDPRKGGGLEHEAKGVSISCFWEFQITQSYSFLWLK